MWETFKKYSALLVMALLIALALFSYFRLQSYQNEIADLRNQAASKDKTLEELKGTYTKLVTENDRLRSSDKELQDLFAKTKQDLIAETQARVYWKGQYEYALSHGTGQPIPSNTPSVVSGPSVCTDTRLAYTSVQDIGLLKLTLKTLTYDPQYSEQLSVSPGSKPLILTLDLTRDRKLQWHSHITSSDERIGVELGINSVNVEPLEEHWYERIRLVGDLGTGKSAILGGVGATYGFGRWDLGPKVWATTTGQTFMGLTLSWSPFKQSN